MIQANANLIEDERKIGRINLRFDNYGDIRKLAHIAERNGLRVYIKDIYGNKQESFRPEEYTQEE